MKVKNIAFSGFAAAILAMGAAQADVPQIASKTYVDNKITDEVKVVDDKVGALNTTLTTHYTTTEELGDVITTNITNALDNDNSAISQALAGKVDSDEKTDTIGQTTDVALIPTVGAVTAYTQNAIDAKFGEGGLTAENIANGAVGTDQIANKAVTFEKLSDALNEKIDAAQTADDVSQAIADAVTTDGALKTALDGKVTEAQVDTAIKGYAIPKPGDDCTADSGRCLLSVDRDGKLTWIDVTKPLGDEE